MIGPAGKEQVDLSKEAQHRWDSAQGEQAEAQAEGDQRVFLIETGVIGNPVAACSDREQDDAGEGPQIHEQIGRHVEHHCGEAVFGAADHSDHHESGLANRAVGQHPFHRCLCQSHHVAQGHAQHGQDCEEQLPLAIEGTETAHQNSQCQRKPCGFGSHRQKGNDRSRRSFVNVWSPLVEGNSCNLEGDSRQHKNKGQRRQWGGACLKGDADGLKAGAAAQAVEQRRAVKEDSRCG